jgi:hypothetical protein
LSARAVSTKASIQIKKVKNKQEEHAQITNYEVITRSQHLPSPIAMQAMVHSIEIRYTNIKRLMQLLHHLPSPIAMQAMVHSIETITKQIRYIDITRLMQLSHHLPSPIDMHVTVPRSLHCHRGVLLAPLNTQTVFVG